MLDNFGGTSCVCGSKIYRNIMNEENLTKAKYGEWQLSLFGACFIAGGIGYLLAPYLTLPIISVVILVGIVMHSIGMYKIYQRNK